MSDAPLGWCQNGWVKREMNRRDEAERAERAGGLSLQAWLGKKHSRREARHKTLFTL